jgi:hypothetical protein
LWAEEKCFDAATMEALGPLVAVSLVLIFVVFTSPQNNNVKNLCIDENKLLLLSFSPILLLIVMVVAA